jgi:hypothetical protein
VALSLVQIREKEIEPGPECVSSTVFSAHTAKVVFFDPDQFFFKKALVCCTEKHSPAGDPAEAAAIRLRRRQSV